MFVATEWEGALEVEFLGGIVEGCPVWLADGSTRPIEDVAALRLPVLSYDKAWDTRPVRYGANQGPRDRSVGRLARVTPAGWARIDARPVFSVRFASGRTVETGGEHPWVTQRRSGRQAWEWKKTETLNVGDRVPFPLTASQFGVEGEAAEGYFVGAMLGDGGMTSCTPEFYGDPADGATAFMREFAARHGCRVREIDLGAIVRMRFPYKSGHRNPLTDILRDFGVWGMRCEVKALPDRILSRDFWIGCLAGLIDTDGCVRQRVNPRGTLHGSVEYATVSSRLAAQVSDILLRLGVSNLIRERPLRMNEERRFSRTGFEIVRRRPLYQVEVSRATAVVRLGRLLELRIGYKAARLADLVTRVSHVELARSEMHGYDEAVALDRVKAVSGVGQKPVYGSVVEPCGLIVANGIITSSGLPWRERR
jgi:intein/homing endonuclease